MGFTRSPSQRARQNAREAAAVASRVVPASAAKAYADEAENWARIAGDLAEMGQ